MRTAVSFEDHKNKSHAQCLKSWVVLSHKDLLGYDYLISPHLCKSDYCPVCRPRNLLYRRKQLFRLLNKDRWRMVELTFKNHKKDKTEQFVEAHEMLKKLIQRLRRIYKNFKYVRVFEVHKSGYPHVHLVVNCYIPVKSLYEHWKELGGGFVSIHEPKCSKCGGSLPCLVHHQKKFISSKNAARYLTEELEKKKQDPHALGVEFWIAQVRSITTSRNLPLKKLPSSGEWMYVRGAPNLKDAMYEYEKLMYDHEFNGGLRPSVDYGENIIKVGVGYRESPDVKFDFGK